MYSVYVLSLATGPMSMWTLNECVTISVFDDLRIRHHQGEKQNRKQATVE